jgi:hypothetical protein
VAFGNDPVHEVRERGQRRVTLRHERRRGRPLEPQLGIGEVASELVFDIPIFGDGVDVERGLAEVEPMRNARGNHHRGHLLSTDLDGEAQPRCRRVGAKIAEAEKRTAADHGHVIRVAQMHVHAPENVGLRMHRVPLDRGQRRKPRLAEQLGEDAAIVGVHS